MTGPMRMRTRIRLAVLAATAQAAMAVAAPSTVTVTDAAGTPLDDAVVAFVPESGPRIAKGSSAEIEQRERQFAPRVTVVQTGTAVSFPNRDTVRHHVYSFSQAKAFELKLYIGTPAEPVVFDKPGTVVLGCNIHDQMVAWVHVVETPWFARSTGGTARVAEVPAGSYRLQVWHPRWPDGKLPHVQDVRVGSTATALTVRLPLAAQP